MKYPTIRFVFDRKKEASRHKKGLVQLVISHQRKRKLISTGIKVYSGQWSEQQMVINCRDAVSFNKVLTAMRQRINDWLLSLQVNNEEFTFSKLETALRFNAPADNFIDFVSQQIEERTDIRERTKINQRKLISCLNEFKRITSFADITTMNILAFDSWLHSKNIMVSTIYDYHKILKSYIYAAVRSEIIDHNPYSGLHFDRGQSSTRKYLTDEELSAIKNADITLPRFDRVRDLFLFQCFTGLSYAELSSLDYSKITKRGEKYVIHSNRQKTGEPFYIVLLSPALRILQKYSFKLPVISNQKYNILLKAVAAMAGLEKNLTSHMGRHTFAVYALNHGVRIEHVSKMLGHTNIKTTQIYAKVLDAELEKDFGNLEAQLSDIK